MRKCNDAEEAPGNFSLKWKLRVVVDISLNFHYAFLEADGGEQRSHGDWLASQGATSINNYRLESRFRMKDRTAHPLGRLGHQLYRNRRKSDTVCTFAACSRGGLFLSFLSYAKGDNFKKY